MHKVTIVGAGIAGIAGMSAAQRCGCSSAWAWPNACSGGCAGSRWGWKTGA